MATKKVTTPDLKSKNGLNYKQLLRNDKLIVLTTADNKIGVYEASGKCIVLLDSATLGPKVPPANFQVAADSKSAFFVDEQGNLQYLDLSGADLKPATLMKGMNTERLIISGDELLFLKSGTGLIENLKKEGNTYKETPNDVPNPASSKAAKATGVGACGKEVVLITYDNGKAAIYNSKKDAYVVEDIANLPKLSWDQPIYYHEAKRYIFGISVGAVVQYSIDSKDIVKQYAAGQYGEVQTFGIDGDHLYLITGSHFLVFRIVHKKSAEAELVDALKFKFTTQYPNARVFFNLSDMLNLTFVAGEAVDTLKLSPIWEKVEREPLRTSQMDPAKKDQNFGSKAPEKSMQSQEGQMGKGGYNPAQDYDYQQSDDPEGFDDAYRPAKAKAGGAAKKKKVVKKRKTSFDLNGMHHFKSNEYNALRDEHLKSYFYSYRIRDHLIKQNLVAASNEDHQRRIHHREPRRVQKEPEAVPRALQKRRVFSL